VSYVTVLSVPVLNASVAVIVVASCHPTRFESLMRMLSLIPDDSIDLD
jgi:hypothetical protein